MEWLALMIPFISALIGLVFFKREIHKIEILVPILFTILFIFAFKFFAIKQLTQDTEYLGGKIVRVEYYEDWNEYVHQTCYRTVSCGKNCTTTVPYDCSYVSYHSEFWQLVDDNGFEVEISQDEYNRLVTKFENNTFIDLDRDYFTNDGDKYVTYWLGGYDKIENVVVTNTYKNKVQATRNLFHYEQLDSTSIKELFKYPKVYGYKQEHLLGLVDNNLSLELDKINGLLAHDKELKLFLLVYNNKPIDVSFKQETFWQGGNKNEFIVTIGINDDKVGWCRVISWTENNYSKIDTRNLLGDTSLDSLQYNIKKLIPILENSFERKHFSDFKYINVVMTNSQITWLFLLTLIFNVIILVIVINNEIN